MTDAAHSAQLCVTDQHALQAERTDKIMCAPSAGRCLRCQITPEKPCSRDINLLLGAQDADAATALRQILDAQEYSYSIMGPLVVLPNVRYRLALIGAALKTGLSPYAQSCIRAAYVPGGTNADKALTALLFAEPLAWLIEHMEHEWIRDALAEGWLYSVFHPIVDAQTGNIHAYEALLRARHPQDDHIIGAGPIFQASEALNLQHQLDQCARRSAIKGASEALPASAKVFINFLPNTIYDPEICLRTTMQAADEAGIPLSRLVFEVVETEHISDMQRLHRILDYYRSRGVGTAVDDMGAGFTSIEYLTALRPDYVKLDRELLLQAEDNQLAMSKFEAIVGMAQQLGIRTVAEGIETVEQMQMCLRAGVELLQGYLFAKPANPPQAISYPVAMRRVA